MEEGLKGGKNQYRPVCRKTRKWALIRGNAEERDWEERHHFVD